MISDSFKVLSDHKQICCLLTITGILIDQPDQLLLNLDEQIIDNIMDGRRFDFSFQYGNDILVPYMFRNQIIAQSNDIVSTYEKSQKTIETKLSAIAGYYGLE